MSARRELLVDISVELTGFSRVQLLGTGMSERYLQELDEILPAGMVDDLFAVFARNGADDSAVTEILADAVWGAIARNIMTLWYCGTWIALPEAWRAAHGASPRDTNHVVSAEAYQAGLQWALVGAHPAGARQQGFGAWEVAPEEAVS